MSLRSTARQTAAAPARRVARVVVRARTRGWMPVSRLFAVGERTGWSVDEDAAHLEAAAMRLGYTVEPSSWARDCRDQAVFVTSHFEALLSSRWLESSHRLGTAYLHGRPGTPGSPEFDATLGALRRNADRLARVQVTHEEMRELVLAAGVAPERVFLIRIGVDLERFPPVDAQRRAAARQSFDLSEDAFVVGSFQKDGVGWGEGLEPKLIKGPDVLVDTLEGVHRGAPELHVLLSGPARGYVRRELERLRIPYRHTVAATREELAIAYHALDAYVVPSRQEGGPKGVLEAMAAGAPLASTRVGQAQDLVENGQNGLLVDVEEAEALAEAVLRLHADAGLRRSLAVAGRETAERFSHERLDPEWDALLDGLVAKDGG